MLSEAIIITIIFIFYKTLLRYLSWANYQPFVFLSPSSLFSSLCSLQRCVSSLHSWFIHNGLVLNWHNWSSSTYNQFEIDFINVLRDFYLLQHVSCPSRFRGADTPHVLDLVISNDSFVEEVKYLAPLGNSDHSVIYVKCFLLCNYRLIEGELNYNKGDYVGLTNSLDIDWDSTFEPCAMIWNRCGIYLKIQLSATLASSFLL
jgi:hypothetical protein